MILLFQEIRCTPPLCTPCHRRPVGDGVGAELGAYCSLLRLKDRRIPANGCRRQLAARRPDPVPIVIFWLMSPGAGLGSPARAFFLSGPAYLVIFPSWLAYLFWNKGIATIGTRRNYTHIIPLSGGVLSILFLHTQPQARICLARCSSWWGLGSARWRNAAASIRLRD